MSAEILIEHINFILNNIYFSNTPDIVLKKICGIPMGTNCAPELANLTLYVTEATFIDNLVNTADSTIYKKYAHTKRWIDDIIIFNAPPPSAERYHLEYSNTSISNNTVVFLGARISCINNQLHMSVFDKTLKWNFPVLKYPHYTSNVPVHQSKGLLMGQLHRARTICNSLLAFKIATTNVVLRLLMRQHPLKTLVKSWNSHLHKFSSDKITNYSQLRSWFNRMLYWTNKQVLSKK